MVCRPDSRAELLDFGNQQRRRVGNLLGLLIFFYDSRTGLAPSKLVMTAKLPISPLEPVALKPGSSAARQPISTQPAPVSSDAVVSSVKPDLSGEAASKEAERLAASLTSAGSKGLDAIKPLDRAAIDRLLSDD